MSSFFNGKKVILLANDVPSITNPGVTGDLYVEVAGKKVIFSIVQGLPGDRVETGHALDPSNEFLVLKDSRIRDYLNVVPKTDGFVQKLGMIGVSGGGYAYAKSKADPTPLTEEQIGAFAELIETTFAKDNIGVSFSDKDTALLLKVLDYNLGIDPAGLSGSRGSLFYADK